MKLQKDMRDFTNKVNNLKKQVQENFASSRAKIRKKLVEVFKYTLGRKQDRYSFEYGWSQ